MKKLSCLVLFSLFVALYSFSQASWSLQTTPLQEDLVSVCFADESNGWIVSAEGSILNTTDGGNTWNIHAFPDYRLAGVHFTDANHGYAVGWTDGPVEDAVVMKTVDGGFEWTLANNPGVNRLNDVFFRDNSTGWVVGTYNDLNLNCCLYTTDGGINWTLQSSPAVAEGELFGVHFRDDMLGVVCGANGAFFHTNSGGVSGWSMNISMPLVHLNAIWNSGTLDGCCVGDDGTILYTINNWYQHIDQVSGTDEDMLGVHAPPGVNKYWAVGRGGTILYTSYYLFGWTSQVSGTIEDLHDVWMLSEELGWAVGANGTLLRYSMGTGIGLYGEALTVQVTPNPAHGPVSIEVNPGWTIDRIEVINIFGQVEEAIQPADNSNACTLDLSHRHPGVYFLKVSSGQEVFTRRLTIRG